MNNRLSLLPLGLGLCAAFSGCRSCNTPSNCTSVAPLPPAQLSPYAPLPQGGAIQTTPVPQGGPIQTAPAAPQPIPQNSPTPLPVFPDTRRYEPQPPTAVQPQWRAPANGQMQYIVPDNGSSMPSRDSARLQPPELSGQSGASASEPPQRTAPPAFPTIPNFASAKEQVSFGRRPALDEVDWLRAKNYRAVLYVRAPGEDDSADRKLFETRGLAYGTIEVSPATLSSAMEQFNKIVGEKTNLPLFVYYYKDPMLAGALWYLHFRTVEDLKDAEAKFKATQLGLAEPSEANKPMWLAIEKYLADQKQSTPTR